MSALFEVVLVFLACAGPGQCQRVELPWDGSMMQCHLFGQQQVATWTRERPGWTIVNGYTCAWGKDA